MLRYYMSPETQQAVIAESNRLIARRSTTRQSRTEGGAYGSGESEFTALDADGAGDGGDDSAFARLVSDLQALSSVSRSQ